MKRYLVPMLVFGIVVGFLGVGLTLNPRELPSPLVGKPMPPFELPQLQDPENVFAPDGLRGQVWLFNVWASWCSGCQEEHPILMKLAKAGDVPVYGMDYKDRRDDALSWLRRHGNPYPMTAFDEAGRVGIDYGVYGVPETYVIDRQGVVRYKHIGPLDEEILQRKILPLVRELQKS